MAKLVNILFVLLVLISFTISGYYAKQDINDMAYVIAIGVDVRQKR